MDAKDEKISQQVRKYSSSIAKGCSTDALAEIAGLAEDAEPTRFFKDRWDVRFWYEKLDKEGLGERAKDVADRWAEVCTSVYLPSSAHSLLQNENNIQRAAAQVNRPFKTPDRSLVRGYGVYRFKKLSNTEWKPLRKGAGMDDEFPDTVVCIALNDLGPENGFFTRLSRGEDLCLDGGDDILLPPTGGGLVMLLWIDI